MKNEHGRGVRPEQGKGAEVVTHADGVRFQIQCQRHPDCVYFTFRNASGECKLYDVSENERGEEPLVEILSSICSASIMATKWTPPTRLGP